MRDETLEQEMREQLLSEGVDEDSVDVLVEELASEGMFDV